MTARSAGSVRIALGESTGYVVSRGKKEVESSPDDSYSIYLQMRSQAIISQGNQVFTFQPGDIARSWNYSA